MGRLWDLLKGSLNTAESARPDQPFIHESIDLKSYPVDQFLKWHQKGLYLELSDEIAKSYKNFLISRSNTGHKVDILLSKSSNGLILYCQQLELSESDCKHFMYLLQRRFLEYKYLISLADVRSRRRGNCVEMVYRHYLKPSQRQLLNLGNYPDGKMPQLFGNISLEYMSRDGKPYILKLLANNYQDQNYHQAEEFSKLINIVCQEH